MILFDLKCSFDHVFEAWFRDSNEFNKQRKTKLITCPVCEDTQITKSLMNINIQSVDISASDGVASCLIVFEIRDLNQLIKLHYLLLLLLLHEWWIIIF